MTLDGAVNVLRPAEAAEAVAEAAYRAAVRTGLVRLRDFKRDLKGLGLTEAQIHEIIPDRPARRGRSGGGGAGGSGGATVVAVAVLAASGAAAVWALLGLLVS